MGLIDSGSKSSRLLASRRYTHNTFTTAQESFTNVLDLRAEEIYTRAHLIPSSSLPFSGSSQLGLTHSVKGQPVVKYWFRQQLTKSNTNNEVWFFTNPTGSGEGIGAQLIDDNQQTNFVSPKYSLSSLASATTEDSTPGYLAVLYKSTAVASSEETSSLGSGDIVSTNDYIFDYKTGVVQFLNSDKDPSDSEYVYMTAYQYVGDTLKSGIEIEGQVSASNLLVTDTLKAGTLISPEITLATASIEAITASVAEMKEFTNADTISGSFTALSGSVATRFDSRETDMTLATASIEAITSSISRLDSETETNDANITLATASIAAITASVSRIDSEIDTNAANITLATASIAAITASLGQPVNTDSDVTFGDITSTGTITAVEVHTTFVSSSIAVISGSNNFGDEVGDLHSFTGSIAVSSSLSVTGSTTIDGTLTVDEIGAFTAGGAIDFNDQNMTNVDIDSGDITGITFGTTTSAIITGSTTAVSSSIATRFDSRETDMTLATASIAAITASVAEMKEFTKATTISGSFTSVSSSIATRFDSREVDMTLATASIAAITSSISRIDSEIDTNAANITLATASIAALTASISRLNDEISTDDTDMNLATASIAAITASISRIDSEIDTNAANITLATASIAAITASLGQPVNTDSDVTFGDITSTGTITAVEVHTTFVSSSIAVISGSNNFGDDTSDHHSFTGSLSVSSSLSVTGSTTIDGTLTVDEIGAFTAGGAIDFGDQNMTNVDIDSGDITGVTFGTATSTTISGSTTAVSSSIATRFDSRETDMTLATASIAAITASVSRIDSEIDTNTTNITLATASIAAITSSISELKTSATLSTASIAAITASISRINDSLDETSGIFEQTGSFFRTHNDLQITGSLSVSGLLTGSFSGLEVGQKYKHVQTTPSSTWTVSHGFDYQYVNIDVYNGSDELVIPASVVATDSNTITISFNTPLSGVAIVSTGGQAVDELGKNVIFEQSTVSTNWRVTHSIGEQYPAVTVYDENDNVIIPERINAVDASKMDIIFTNAVSGNANISVGGGQLRNAITGSEQLSFDSFGDISGSVSSTGSFGRLEVVGNGNIDGNLTLGGNITIGDADSDSITINADLTSNLIPNADSTFDLGSTSKFWRNAYIDSITTTGNISGSVSSTGSFGNVNVSEMSITSVSIMSSSVATRFDSRETDMTLATASIAAITSSVSEMKEFTVASTISGSFTAVSSSIASRLDSLSGDVIALSIALG